MRAADVGRAPRGSTEIIGRTDEIHALEDMLASPSSRLVTVSGPPGVGKSRLAREVARRSGSRFPDGVRSIELAGVTTPAEALTEVARGCGVGDRSGDDSAEGLAVRIGQRLRDEAVLLVLDCCERLPELGRTLGLILVAAPRVKVLATSRACFRIASEIEFPLLPLAVPEPDTAADLDRLAGNDAVRLLLARAQLVRPEFELSEENAAAVTAICGRADGLPLAIELLAARLTTFSPQELAVRLRHRHVLLESAASRTGEPRGRHPTLRAAIGWSHDLLGPAERHLLRTVSVFPRAWTLAAAEQLVGDPDVDVAGATRTLVDQNLVQHPLPNSESGSYRLLDSVREFAAEQLQLHGEEDDVRRRHMAYYAGLAAAAEANFGSRDETPAQNWIVAEQTNLRQALGHALDVGDVAAALPLAAAHGWYEFSHGYLDGGRDRVERALDAAHDESVSSHLLVGTLLVSGVLAERHGTLDLATARLREALLMAERDGDLRRQAVAHAFLGHVARRARSYQEAAREYTRALALHETTGNEHSRAWAWVDLGLLALEQEQLDTAETHLQAARAWFEDAGEAWPLGWALWALGETRLRQGSTGEAAGLLSGAVTILRRVDDLRSVASCLEGLAAVACRRGRGEVAAQLAGAAGRLRGALRTPPAPVSASTIATTDEALTRLLGPAEAARATRTGSTLPIDAAIALATSLTDTTSTAASPLSQRQREVAVLVAAGRTNRQIGRTLGVTEKTVEAHLAQAMRRIGAHSRSEIAIHAADAGLRTGHTDPAPVEDVR